jgi:hypothetical protein
MRCGTLLVICAMTLVLQGCMTPLPIFKWSKLGATYQQYLQDRYACILDARKQVSGGYFQGGVGSPAAINR